ncbi:hypothetical protein BGZ75_004938 [Mortierella antarctica]|nr:hypothetical protein BGZ75_004938 [Mortierella antarctica]
MDNSLALESPWLDCIVNRKVYRPQDNKTLYQFSITSTWSARPVTVIFDPRKTRMTKDEYRAKLMACKEETAIKIKGDYLLKPWAKAGVANLGLKFGLADVVPTGTEAEIDDDDFAVEKEFQSRTTEEMGLFAKAIQAGMDFDKNLSQVQDPELVNILVKNRKRPRGMEELSDPAENVTVSDPKPSGFVNLSGLNPGLSGTIPESQEKLHSTELPAVPSDGSFRPHQLNQGTKRVFDAGTASASTDKPTTPLRGDKTSTRDKPRSARPADKPTDMDGVQHG